MEGVSKGFPDPAPPDPPDPPQMGVGLQPKIWLDAGSRSPLEVETDPPENGSHVSHLSELAGVPIAGSSLYPPGVQDAA